MSNKKSKIVEEPRRTFKGKLDGFTSVEERNYEKKHLKGYLKGDQMFSFGINKITKEPIYFKVL